MTTDAEKRLLDQIEDDLVQITDVGDGSTEYDITDGDLVVTYWEDDFDSAGNPVPEGRYVIEINVRKIQ